MILQGTIRLLTDPFCSIRSQISEMIQHVQFNRKFVVQVHIIVLCIRRNYYDMSRIQNLTVKNNIHADNINTTYALTGHLRGPHRPNPHTCGYKYYYLSTGNKNPH